MKYTIRGKGATVDLNQKHFLAAGGEGKVYVKDKLAYKICEPGKMIPDGKFQELSVLDHPKIVRPQDVLLDGKDNPVGYTMQYVTDTYVLCQLFTKAFRNRNNITPEMSLKLVQQMQDTISFVHSRNVLLVDLNELNFLMSQHFTDIFFIDVNSYQTKSYPAMAIMDSIRDRHCNNHFTTETDWFSFAIVSFQMMIGIHPFKGRHPSYADLDARMKANISVLNPDVSYPTGACMPFSVIPDNYLEWYKAVFEKGMRVAPPTGLVGKIYIVQPSVKKIAGSNNFEIIELYDFGEEIVGYFQHGGKEVALTTGSLFIDRHKQPNYVPSKNTEICFTPKALKPISVSLENNRLKLLNLVEDKELAFTLQVNNFMTYEGRLYATTGTQILEILFTEIGNNILVSSHHIGNVLGQAATVFDGVVLQNLFDAYYASVFPTSKECRQFALRELDNHKVVDAKYERGLLVIVGVDKKTGKYDRFVFWFTQQADKSWKTNHMVVKDITFTGLNFTVLDNGTCVLINEEEKLEVFKVADPTKKKEIDDPVIEADMLLSSRGSQVLFTRDNKVYSISMYKN